MVACAQQDCRGHLAYKIIAVLYRAYLSSRPSPPQAVAPTGEGTSFKTNLPLLLSGTKAPVSWHHQIILINELKILAHQKPA